MERKKSRILDETLIADLQAEQLQDRLQTKQCATSRSNFLQGAASWVEAAWESAQGYYHSNGPVSWLAGK
jgi:hypothetical protein